VLNAFIQLIVHQESAPIQEHALLALLIQIVLQVAVIYHQVNATNVFLLLIAQLDSSAEPQDLVLNVYRILTVVLLDRYAFILKEFAEKDVQITKIAEEILFVTIIQALTHALLILVSMMETVQEALAQKEYVWSLTFQSMDFAPVIFTALTKMSVILLQELVSAAFLILSVLQEFVTPHQILV